MKNNIFVVGTLASAVSMALVNMAQAQEAPPVASVQSVVVTGFRSSIEKSLNLKRASIVTRDTILSEDVGKFPEANVADSLQRIPGITLSRDGLTNEGQRISIRGLGSEFAVTTVNGAPVHTTSQGSTGSAVRDFNYDVFASELFGRVDFYKTPLAELEEGGVGGVVDLQTPRPFDKSGRVVRFSSAASYNTGSKSLDPRAFAAFSNTWGHWGFLMAGATSSSKNNRSGFEITDGNMSENEAKSKTATFTYKLDLSKPENYAPYTAAQVRDAQLPRFYRAYASTNSRNRKGLNTSLQYKNDKLNVSLDTLFSTLQDEGSVHTLGYPVRNSGTAIPAIIPRSITIDGNNQIQGRFDNVSMFNGNNHGQAKTEFASVGINAAYKLNSKFRLSTLISHSESEATVHQNNMSVLSGKAALQTVTFDTRTDSGFPTMRSTADLLDTKYYNDFQAIFSTAKELDKQDSIKGVAEYDYEAPLGIRGKLKVGISSVSTTKQTEKRNGNTLGASQVLSNGQTFTKMTIAEKQALLTPIKISDYTSDAKPGFPAGWLIIPRSALYGTLEASQASDKSPLDTAGSFTAVEDIKTLFVQSDLEREVFGRDLRMNVGARYSQTKTTINNYKRVNTYTPAGAVASSSFVPDTKNGGYNNLLPSFSAAYDASEDVVLRTSWGKTITRNSLSLIAPNTVIPDPFTLKATTGNPDLKPQLSTSIDASAEWYFSKGSVLSLGLFDKKIKDKPLANVTAVPFTSLGLDDSALGAIYKDASGKVIPGTMIQKANNINADKYKLKGFELAYQQSFKSLPAPFDGLGALASYTRVKSEGVKWKALNGQLFDITLVPKYSYSITPYYEKGPVAVRLSYNYKSEYAENTNNIGNDYQRWAKGRGYLDASVSYKINDSIDLRLDGSNLNNELIYSFFRSPFGKNGSEQSRIEGAYYNGRVVMVGIRGKL